MKETRRYERKNEVIMMEKIDSIISTLGTQNTDIAVIKTKSEQTEKHLELLNSKVATQEGRVQTLEAAQILVNQVVKGVEQETARTSGFIERNWEKFAWLFIAAMFGYVFTQR